MFCETQAKKKKSKNSVESVGKGSRVKWERCTVKEAVAKGKPEERKSINEVKMVSQLSHPSLLIRAKVHLVRPYPQNTTLPSTPNAHRARQETLRNSVQFGVSIRNMVGFLLGFIPSDRRDDLLEGEETGVDVLALGATKLVGRCLFGPGKVNQTLQGRTMVKIEGRGEDE